MTVKNTYIIQTSPAEMARLINQDRLMTEAQGGALADIPTLPTKAQVLDIACGPGGWSLDLAHFHPAMKVLGIDISKDMIDYAQAQAKVQKQKTTLFYVMDAMQPLLFPDSSFDLINASCLSTFMTKEAWPLLLRESFRLLRPGGILRMRDIERGLSNSLAHERVSTLFTQALHQLERTFSPDGYHIGVLPMLEMFFKNAEFENIHTKMFGVDYSSGSQGHDAWCPTLLLSFRLAFPFIERSGGATIEELERLYQKATVEMNLPEFRAILPCLTIWGVKPLKS
jgi:ubiquinone/menaquinone biosynthesis C-methylase UbiE